MSALTSVDVGLFSVARSSSNAEATEWKAPQPRVEALSTRQAQAPSSECVEPKLAMPLRSSLVESLVAIHDLDQVCGLAVAEVGQ